MFYSPATDVAELANAVIMFRGIVLKMHETQTFLATIKNDHWNHENAGCDLASRPAYHHRGSLYGSALDQRAGDCAADELSGFLKPAVSLGARAMLSVDQFLRLVSVPAVFAAFLIASQMSAAVTP